MGEQCSNCRFARFRLQHLGGLHLYCAHDSPKGILLQSQQGPVLFGAWPPVEDDQWCAAWERDPMEKAN